MIKIGIIGCPRCEDRCQGIKDLLAIREGTGVFKELGPSEMVGYVTCGGCPGKNVLNRAKLLVSSGADVLAFSSCIDNADADGAACPYLEQMRGQLSKTLKSVIVVDRITNTGA